MRIEDDLDDREDAARLEGIEEFDKRRLTIRYLSKNGHQHGTIEAGARKRPIAKARGQKLDIRKTGRCCLGLRSSEHAGLDVDGQHAARWADTASERNRQPSGATARVEDGHTR